MSFGGSGGLAPQKETSPAEPQEAARRGSAKLCIVDAPQGRVLALDIGSVRIGAAISDPLRRIAQPLAVWKREGWRKKFEDAQGEYNPSLVLIGSPTRTDGSEGPEAGSVARLVESLKREHPELEFELWDERFTTVIAHQSMTEAGASGRSRRGSVDKVAAALILESWLERQRLSED